MFRSLAAGICLVALSALVAVQPATAEEDESYSIWPHWGMERMMSGDWGPGSAMGWWRSDGMLDRLDGRLAYMKAELKITASQTAAWDKFEKTVKSSAAAHNEMMLSMREGFRAGGIFDRPLPERLAWHVSQLEGRLAQMKSVKAAVDEFYAVLTEDQKVAAAAVFLPMMGMGMGSTNHMMRW